MKLFARICAFSLGSSEDVVREYAPHQESVARFLTSGPSGTVSAGNSSTFATVDSVVARLPHEDRQDRAERVAVGVVRPHARHVLVLADREPVPHRHEAV